MSLTLIWIALVVAVIDWVAVWKEWKLLEYICKPGVMVVLLIWVWQTSGFEGQMLWFGLGLLFSMAGDVFLMLPKEQFIPGLISFLVAHIAYTIGFNDSLPPINLASVVLAVFVFGTAIQIYRRISAGLSASGNEKLKPPVLIYSIVISIMLLSALNTLVRPEWTYLSSILVSIGALLFFLSDTFLAWNKFITPLPYGRLRTMITYHLGQILIVVGATLHYTT